MTNTTVLLDTSVLGAWLKPVPETVVAYHRHVVGRLPAIALQTAAELRFGALAAGWGERRRQEVEALIGRCAVLPNDDETAMTWASLRAACRARGHPLGQKHQMGDLWVAATAVRWGIPLVTDDADFRGCPGLEVITEQAVVARRSSAASPRAAHPAAARQDRGLAR